MKSSDPVNPYEALNEVIERAHKMLVAGKVCAMAEVGVAETGGKLRFARGRDGWQIWYADAPTETLKDPDFRLLRDSSIAVKTASLFYIPALFVAVEATRDESIQAALKAASSLNDWLNAKAATTTVDVQA